jgi:hypothetical protein
MNFFMKRDLLEIGYILSSKLLRNRLTPIINFLLKRNLNA